MTLGLSLNHVSHHGYKNDLIWHLHCGPGTSLCKQSSLFSRLTGGWLACQAILSSLFCIWSSGQAIFFKATASFNALSHFSCSFFVFLAATSSELHHGLGIKMAPGCLSWLACKLTLRLWGIDIPGCFDIGAGMKVVGGAYHGIMEHIKFNFQICELRLLASLPHEAPVCCIS